MPDLIKERNHTNIENIRPTNEVAEIVENFKETISEAEPTTEKKHQPEASTRSSFIKRKPTHVIPSHRDQLTQRIEKILEENVGEAYSRLSPIAKEEFKMKGEVTAQKIRELLQSTHVKIKKIFHLIFDWLKMLPGVNRFFLEQEAKIKTDKIIALHKKAFDSEIRRI